MTAFAAPLWLACAVVIIGAAIRSRHSQRAAAVGRQTVAALYLGAGALVNAIFLATGEDYRKFADGTYIAFVHHTWRDLVVPNHLVFISALIVFEAAVGLLVLSGGRRAEIGLSAAIAFHVALLSFGWGFFLWSIPMIAAFVQLLRANRLGMVVTVPAGTVYAKAA